MNTPLQQQHKQTAEDIRAVCDEIADFLIKKNESYGDSALNPTRIMSKANAIEGILVRIDDKLNRIKQGTQVFSENDELDLTGYFVLLRIARRRAVKNEYINAGAPIPNKDPLVIPRPASSDQF